MSPRLIRMIEELNELDGRLEKLATFLNHTEDAAIAPPELSDLRLQHTHMAHYRKYLARRVCRLVGTEVEAL